MDNMGTTGFRVRICSSEYGTYDDEEEERIERLICE